MERCAELGSARSSRIAALILLPAFVAVAEEPLHERASASFREKRYDEAARWLQRALRENSDDAFASDFLATVYYLQGNLEAALKYWNRVGKPVIGGVAMPPDLRTDPVLLDRVLPFGPGSVLSVQDLRVAQARLDGLGVFANESLRLNGRADRAFDFSLVARERNGWGRSPRHAVLSMSRGLGYLAVHPEYFNIGGRAVNATSMIRFDPQKRRANAALSGPWRGDPRYRYWFDVDGRDERWEIRGERLRLQRVTAAAGLSSFGVWRWSWGGEVSRRGWTGSRVDGYQLKQSVQVARDLLRVPERKFESSMRLWSETGRIWSAPSHVFQRVQASGDARWGPLYGRLRAGRIFGQVPIDELFILGLERDNDLPMRAHIGTRDGRKGSAPMGQRYGVASAEWDKTVHNDGLTVVKLSPFLDTGTIGGVYGAGKWLWDTGIQAKVRVLGVGFTFTYGKDLRSGRNAFYLLADR